ncbi:hypothetical protein FGO68_gene15464 [Halteria grandinella]|uniref:Uncharacterized protein n=1 Tax=Halteria grandinella TaxID=5974 RepID=A0A8J8P5A4_HALGN|nr:hypothetical protein FGO68_gene15464 [Halteria grandinella]
MIMQQYFIYTLSALINFTKVMRQLAQSPVVKLLKFRGRTRISSLLSIDGDNIWCPTFFRIVNNEETQDI